MNGDNRTARAEQRNFSHLESRLESIETVTGEKITQIEGTLLSHSGELDRLDNDMPTDSANFGGANVPLCPFSGTRDENFEQYAKQFELVFEANNYPADKKAQILASYCREKAFYIYDSLPDQAKRDYDQLKAALKDKFQTQDHQRYAHQQFQTRKQHPTETVSDYGCAIHKLGMSALATISPEQRDALIREKFISGLLPQYQELIIYSNPKIFHEAMTFAERLEGVQSDKSHNRGQQVLLLQDINDNLSRMHVSSDTQYRNTDDQYRSQPSFRQARASETRPRTWNLNNVRQQFRPSGVVCFNCRKTGHLARSCTSHPSMNTVMCQKCNAMGHFARDCQRRAAVMRRPPNRQFGGRRPILGTGRFGPPQTQNQAMAITGNQDEEEPDDSPQWEPIVGVVQGNRHESKWSQIKSDKPKDAVAKILAAMRIAKFAILLFLVNCAVTGTWAQSGTRKSSPMLCHASEAKSIWKLPRCFNCPGGNHTAEDDVKPQSFRLYKQNYVQYRTAAWKCVKIIEEMETFTYFFDDENLKKSRKSTLPVSSEECTAMRRFKRCGNQQMVYEGGIFQTSNSLNWFFPGGGVNCCYWKKFTVQNCYLYETVVYKRHGSKKMESAAGDVSKCDYQKGQCIMKDDSFLLWKVNSTALCNLLPWKTVAGKSCGTSWLSDDSNLALTFTRKLQTRDCEQNPLLLADQGIAVMPVDTESKVRIKKQLTMDDLGAMRKVISGGGVVSSAQLASSLQALEMRWRLNTNFAFSYALNSVCNFMQTIIELLTTQVLANPTNAVRSMTNQSAVFARSGAK